MRFWARPTPEPPTPNPSPRGVTVYTIAAAEYYALGDSWTIDDKELLHISGVDQRLISTHLHGTWIRVEIGAPPEQPTNPQGAAE